MVMMISVRMNRRSMEESAPIIVHITTVHNRVDPRISIKEMGVAVSACSDDARLIVADGLGDSEPPDSVYSVLDIGKPPGGRLGRALIGSWQMFRRIRSLKLAIVHFHDPELLLLGFVLKLFGYTVIYDVHEDVPRQILDKHWLPGPLRRPVAWCVSAFESMAGKAFDAVVAATPAISACFPEGKTLVVQNFPFLEELVASDYLPYQERPRGFAYIGTIARIRGVMEIIRALEFLDEDSDLYLELAGNFDEEMLKTEVRSLPGWSRVHYHGWVNRAGVVALLSQVRAGLVVLHPTGNYTEAYPVKLFEYMSASLPVIASDFPLWRRIVEEAGCGLLVDPLDPEAIAETMRWILEHPDEAGEMGRRGRRAVEEKYNWETEAGKLRSLYERLLA